MGLDLLIQGTVAATSGESLFLTESLCSGEVLGPAARSSGGAVNSKCSGDLSLHISAGQTFLGLDM